MEITEITISLQDEDKLKAFVNVIFDDCFVVHELRIIDGKAGLFVAMPSRKMPNGEFKDVAHPINQETRNMIERIVIEAYNQIPDTEKTE